MGRLAEVGGRGDEVEGVNWLSSTANESYESHRCQKPGHVISWGL